MCVIIVGSQTSSGVSLGEIWNWPPYSEGREWPKKEAGHPRLVGGSINKQGNLHTRLVLGGHKRSRFPFCTHQTESECFYRGLNWVQSRVTSQIEIPHFYLKAVSLELLLGVGKASRGTFQVREKVRSLQLPGSSWRVKPGVTSSWWPPPKII